MMQQLATAQSEVATFASPSTKDGGAKDLLTVDSEGDFGLILKAQQQPASAVTSAKKGRTPEPEQQQSQDNNQLSGDAAKDAATTDTINSEVEQDIASQQTTESAASPSSEQTQAPVVTEATSIDSSVSDIEARLQSDTVSTESLSDDVSDDSSQLWVSLVGKLQQFNQANDKASVQSDTDSTQTSIAAISAPLSEAELDTEQSLQQLVEWVKSVLGGQADKAAKQIDSAKGDAPELAEGSSLIEAKQIIAKILADEPALKQAFEAYKGEESAPLALDFISDLLLAEVSEAQAKIAPETTVIADFPKSDSVPSTNVSDITTENLEQKGPTSQSDGISDIEIALSGSEGEPIEDDVAFNSQSVGLEQPLSEVADTTEDQDSQVVTSEVIAQTEALIGNEPAIKHAAAETVKPEIVTEAKLMSAVEVADESEQVAQSVSSPKPATAKPEQTGIQLLSSMSPAKLDSALTKMAEQLLQVEQSAASSTTDKIESVVVDGPLMRDFVSALKSGVNEFKQQVAQGREPGIDLKGLVSEALTKASEQHSQVKLPESIEQNMANMTQMVDFASALQRTVEQQTSSYQATYSVASRDAAQIQGEQVKQQQVSQLEQKFEKAVNITKTDGLQELSEKIRWMTNAKNLVAEIRLDPADLGSVQVRVALSGESATVNFVVQSQQAREAMEQAAPRLREMLAEKGIELGQSSVRQEAGSQQQDSEQREQSGFAHQHEDADVDSQLVQKSEQKIVNGALGGIDYFV